MTAGTAPRHRDSLAAGTPTHAETPDSIEKVPAPVVLFHIAERRTDAALRCNGVAAGWEHLGDAGGIEPRCDHAQCRAPSGASRAGRNDVEGMIDDVIVVGH